MLWIETISLFLQLPIIDGGPDTGALASTANKALQPTANPLRGLSAAELGRSGGRAAFMDFVP